MPALPITRILALAIAFSFLAPPVWSPPASGGSVWKVSGPAFQNGTAANVTLAAQGIKLPCDRSLLGNWTRLDPWPTPRTGAAMAYDSANGAVVFFGGYDGNYRNDTWIYNLATNAWTEMHPGISPEGRNGHSMVYDRANGVVVLYGGTYASKEETWTYNLSADRWTNMYPNRQPGYRWDVAMAYDSANGVTVLFGGYNAPNDTWTYDINANTWTEMHPDPAPSVRGLTGMVYDEAAGAMVLFGGSDPNTGNGLNDTWLYNLSANAWTRKYPAQTPMAQGSHKMAFERATGSAILFGLAYADLGGAFPATWSYNAGTNTWTNRTPAVMPPWRGYSAVAYDELADRTILFGGNTNPYRFDDTWTYNTSSNNWVRMTKNPGLIYGQAIVFDSADGVAVQFGGMPWDSYLGPIWPPTNDTITYNLSTRSWTNMHPSKTPSARISPGLAYDSRNGVTILFGGTDGNLRDDTWAYNLSQNTWKRMAPPIAPPARLDPAMAYDSDNGVVVLYGSSGGSLGMNDTWIYNCTTDTWTEMRPPIGPPAGGAYVSPELVYDRAARLMVMHLSGDPQYDAKNETWTYNVSANRWTNVTGPVAPPATGYPGVAYDEALQLTLVYGGVVCGAGTSETWAFNSSTNTWKKLAPIANPGPSTGPLMLYDSVHDAIILCAIPYNVAVFNTWAYDLKQYLSPGNHTSEAEDLGGQAYFGTIGWDASTSPNATLGFQLRTADTAAGLDNTPFIGPDGTNASYYDQSGQRLNGIHNGTRWMQYRAFLCTTNPAETPVLRSVTIGYNLVHGLSILSPAGGGNWTGTHNITWNASDPDNDALKVDIYLLNTTGSATLATNLSAAAGSWEWNTTPVPSGDYRLRLVARDDNASIPLEVERTSAGFTIFHPIPNRLPGTALLHPADNATVNTTAVLLEWTGSDEDGDPLNYTVYVADSSFGPESLPEAYSYREENTSEVNGLEDGVTYYWTVVAFDGKDNGTVPKIRRFTVDLPPVPVNHPPTINLLRPADNVTVDFTEVTLEWSGNDEDNDSLTFVLAWCAGPFASGAPVCVTTNETRKTLTGLTDGTAYYWMVTVSDGRANATSGVRKFSVAVNHPPRITSLPGSNATVNVTYCYNINATDPDNDTLAYELVTFPSAMELNRTTGRLQWRPSHNGTFDVVVRVLDGRGGTDSQDFNITVKDAPVVRPGCSILTSVAGSVKGRFTIHGTATGDRAVVEVQVSLDGGAWVAASGTSSWNYTVDTTKLENGMHTIKVRAYDGTSHSDEASLEFEVRNAALPVEGGFPWWILGAAVSIAAVGGAAALLTRRKGATAPEEEAEQRPAEEKEEVEPVVELEKEPLPPEAEEIAIRPEERPAPAAAKADTGMGAAAEAAAATAIAGAARAPAPPPAPALKEAPEGFAVEDIFLMYGDGRLIQHTTRRIKADMDADLMASMLTAVKDFIKESVGMADGTELGAMEYGENKILLQKGKHVVLAAVITGAEPADFRDEMKHAVSNIEGELGPVLASWDGMTSKLAGAKKFLGLLGAYRAHEEASAPGKVKTDISLKAELEFYQGFVRLKVAIKNGMETFINDASFRLIYKDAVLRLDHIEPPYPLKGDEVILGNIEPREKKTIAFYLDPQICTESFLEGILSYKDIRGNLEMLKLPRKVASVVCPIVYTDENINTAMLKRMAAEELDKKDTKVFAIPPALAPELAFDLAEAAVQHHDVRLVREFTEEKPFVGEAWYFGKAKGREDRLVIRARVLGEKRVLEFFVASGSTLMLTGMLAELKADLNRELGAHRGAPRMEQVTAPQEVDAVAMVRTLLDKATEAEIGAGETETGGNRS